MDHLTTVRFDTKVLRLPKVFAFHPPSVLASSVLALVKKIGAVILSKPSLAHSSERAGSGETGRSKRCR